MSDFDAAIAAMDDALFETFGVDTTISRAGGEPVPARVVLTRGVERFGEHGQVVGRVTVADIRNSEWAAKPGDVLHLAAGDRAIEAIDKDDGYVTQVVLHG